MNIKSRINLNSDKSDLILFMLMLFPAINNLAWRVVSIVIPISNNVFDICVWIGLCIYLWPWIKDKINLCCFLFYLLFSFLAFTSFIFTNYAVFNTSMLCKLVFETMLVMLWGSCIVLNDQSLRKLYKCSIAVMFISIVYILYFLNSGRALARDNMDYAYRVLPAILIIIANLFVNKVKVTNILFVAIGLIFLISLGTRGPVLCAIACVLIMLYKKIGLTRILAVSCAIGIAVSIFMSSTQYTIFMIKASDTLEDMGLSTRFIELMLAENLSDANGRDAIQDKLMGEVKENPYKIRGIYSDRQDTIGLIDTEYSTSYAEGTYAHNIIIEMLYDYGVIIGTILLLVILFFVVRIFYKNNLTVVYIPVVVVCCGLVHLLLSGSYLTDQLFFFMIGLFANPNFMHPEGCKNIEGGAE